MCMDVNAQYPLRPVGSMPLLIYTTEQRERVSRLKTGTGFEQACARGFGGGGVSGVLLLSHLSRLSLFRGF